MVGFYKEMARMARMALLILLVLPTPAWGYVDPGSGTLLYQVAVAGFVGLLFQSRKVVNLVRPSRWAHKYKEFVAGTRETWTALLGGR